MARDWTQAEVEATVADYFAMLQFELRGDRYNKSEHRRRLQRLLEDRSETAIERKHMNVSAVLRDLGHPWIDGYKPYGNYQRLLMDIVVSRLDSDQAIARIVEQEVDAPAMSPTLDEGVNIWDTPPKSDHVGLVYETRPRSSPRTARNVNYLLREARNRSLGLAGEEFVVRLEMERLHESGRKRLSNRVEHVSSTRGDGLGYDVLSFETDGRERLIEVKTTAYGKLTPIYVTRNEVDCSRERSEDFNLYRVFGFRTEPRLYRIPGSLERTCALEPTQFIVRFPDG